MFEITWLGFDEKRLAAAACVRFRFRFEFSAEKNRSESSLFLAGARSAGHESDGQLREELEKRLVGEHALVAAVEIRQPRRVREAPQRPTSPSSNAYIDGSAVSTKAFRLVY